MDHPRFLSALARAGSSRIVLLVLDGVGDLRTMEQAKTPLDCALTPHLDRLAERASLGRLVPVATGVTPGSGPGHLGLFGYDPRLPENDIGRGVLEALGLGLPLDAGVIAARGNFATVDSQGRLLDRRAGRIPTAEGQRLVERMRAELAREPASGIEVEIHAGEGYRFVLLARPLAGAEPLSAEIEDTDPQRLDMAPLGLRGDAASASTIGRLEPVLERLGRSIRDEPRANAFLLRGFSKLPSLPSFEDLYRLRAGAFAGYPLYRGVASACGMEVVECGKGIDAIVDGVSERWRDFDFFFLHVKQTDMAGEDGDFGGKVSAIEAVDQALPRLLELGPDVIAITADHSTPVPMKAHSWHPVPLLVHAATCFADDGRRFTELEAARGLLGTRPSAELMGLLLAHAARLDKFGA